MSTFDQRLRAADPAAGLAGYDEATIDRAIAAILTESPDESPSAERPSGIAGEAVPIRDSRRGTGPSRRRVLYVALAGAAAAVVYGVVGVPWEPSGPGGPLGASPAAADVLDRAASVAAVDPPARGEQYWAIRTVGTKTAGAALVDASGEMESGATYLVTGERVDYVAVDGARPSWTESTDAIRVMQLSGPKDFGRPERSASAWTSNLTPSDIPSNWQVPSPAFLAGLPRDVTALRERLYADSAGRGPSADGEAVVYVADALRSGLVPADLRSALYRVLETVPGIEVTADQATIDGRTGTALGRFEVAHGQRQELVIDPSSGEVIGERTIQVEARDGIPAGTVVGDTAVTRTLVDEVPERLLAIAERQSCTVTADGGISCTQQGHGAPRR